MSHNRVIPRDFFNEAKLLKCMGQFQLCVHDRTTNGVPIAVDFDGEPFQIHQDPLTGNLSVLNYNAFINETLTILYIPYKSKENYPLIANYNNEEYYVFDEQGKFMPTFGVLK